ncbi:cwfJ domain-containing protein [Coniochaeta sp. 2T2.1]|nr:cwfJ domain-containing protein [Coniochaeta sp. 2T2.1]
MANKIFVFGSISGQLESAFKKLTNLHAKNNFSLALATGNLFSEAQDDGTITALLNGTLSIPCPTYFTVGSHALPPAVVQKIEADEEIAPNLHYLGKRSVTKTEDGVRIVALGGILDTEIVAGQSKEQHLPFHTADDAKALKGANSADILLTAVWPAWIWRGSSTNVPAEPSKIPASESIADLCSALKPRYHFSSSPSDFFYEREPFFHAPSGDETEPSTEVTRFISLAPYGNEAKAKALYAFTLSREPLVTLPQGSTVSPLTRPQKKRPAPDGNGFSRFSSDGHGHHNKRRRQRSPPPGPDKCFFCLGNPNLSTHMVVSIGEDAYLATAKGPLPSAETFKDRGLTFPGHMVIVPLIHAPTITVAGMGEADANRTFAEMSRFKEAIQAAVSSRSGRRLGGVTYEINRGRGIHAHWQFCPVPAEMVSKGLVEAAFRVEAENQKMPKFEVKDFAVPPEEEGGMGDFLRVWIWAEEDDEEGGKIVGKTLVMRFDESVRFDLQFGRRVLAKLLRLEGRMVWQDIGQGVDEETRDAQAFREAFRKWDFTLVEGGA